MEGHDSAPVGKLEAVRIGLLGGFRVWVGLRFIVGSEWRLKKAANLVKLLTLTEDHRMQRDQAMNLLWPELGRKAVANNLYHVLHVARHVLEPEAAISSYLRLHDERLALCPDSPL